MLLRISLILYVLIFVSGCSSLSAYHWVIGFEIFDNLKFPFQYLCHFMFALNFLIGLALIGPCREEARKNNRNVKFWSVLGFLFGIVALLLITSVDDSPFDPNEMDFSRWVRLVMGCTALHISLSMIITILLTVFGYHDLVGELIGVYTLLGMFLTFPVFWMFLKKHLK